MDQSALCMVDMPIANLRSRTKHNKTSSLISSISPRWQKIQYQIAHAGHAERAERLELSGIGTDGRHWQALAMAFEQDLPVSAVRGRSPRNTAGQCMAKSLYMGKSTKTWIMDDNGW
jgi:hypothetical protein